MFFVKDGKDSVKEITLQEYQENQTGYTNFSIDFSDFYNGRGDSSKEASLKELFEKVNDKKVKWRDISIGSIYDQEVILCNINNIDKNKIQNYNFNALEFIIMMVSYSIILDSNKKISVESVVKQTRNCQNFLDDEFVKNIEKNNEKNNEENNDTIKKIVNVLNTVNFEYERENRINTKNGGFSDFAEAFISFYKNIKQKTFYKEIVEAVTKGGENDVSK